ncbi:MAG: Enoyl-CoA hydratase (EC / Delta(3)-cis-delta(2)-trans-enoyl-CoA isomerase (EC / 3-hydroxyacyl-CoA dehydrogenase (EC / 3-hydroxybutyryl-CoA epimerase (EC, partial [uncultured Campylobacterales bacterium]
ALYELELILKDIKSKPLKSLVIKSNKKNNFIAGANIKEIRSLKNEDEAYDKVRSGQQILSLISALPYPTIAVIDGVCLGGGFELALCCDYRIVTDNAKLGLPEVNLGVLPGFGGTQRLPKLTGMTKALELILSGKTIDGKKAYKYGIADAYIPSGYLEFELNEFLNNIPSKRNIKLGIFDKYFPNLVLAIANKKMLAKTKGAYPAPKEIIRVLKETRKSNINEGLDIEATSFAKLCVGNISKNLIELFFINEELKNDQGTTEENIELKEIKQSVVVGGGVMGAGIVWLFSKIGLFVRLKEINNVQIASSLKNVNKIYSYLLKRRKLTKAQISMNMNKISYTTDYSGFKNADLVVEAIVEDLNIKRKVYSEIEENTKPDCIIASNTSSLKISDLASELKHPQRFIGIHFFNPVNRMPLVEIVPGKETSAWTIANSVNIIKKSKKTPIVVGDCAGFLVNRVLFPYINEAAKLFEEGASIEQIDKIALDFGMPMGPFRLLDTVGIDVGYKVAHTLEEAYGSRMSSSKILETIYKDMNLLGEKSKKGFYIYENKKPVLNMDVENLITEKKEFTKEEIQERLIYVMINEASMTLEENIVKNHRQLDMAMIMGIGFPPYRGGLLRYADSIGLDTVLTSLSKLESKYGNRFKASELLISMSKQNKTFYN